MNILQHLETSYLKSESEKSIDSSDLFCSSDELPPINKENFLLIKEKLIDTEIFKTYQDDNKVIDNTNGLTCFDAIIKLLNIKAQQVLINKSIICDDIILSDSIQYNKKTNSIIIEKEGYYLLLLKIDEQDENTELKRDENTELGIYLNRRLIDFIIKDKSSKSIVDMILMDVKDINMIKHASNVGLTANIQIVNHSSKIINIDKVHVTCVKVEVI